MCLPRPGRILLLLSIAQFVDHGARASETAKPLWEIGVAAFGFSIPQYMGDDERYTLPVAIPYFIYRGEFLKIDRDGIRGILSEENNLSLDLGFSFGLPVSNDNKAREDMPELNFTGEMGPRLNWTLDMPEDAPETSLHLPLRYVLDTQGNSLGWVLEPTLKLEKEDFGSENRFSLRLDLGALFTSEAYNDYYYTVEPEYVTDDRPAYRARSGLHSYFAKLIGGYRINHDLNLRLYLTARTLSPGVVADSPLVKDDLYLMAGIGLIWRFWQSDAMVDAD